MADDREFAGRELGQLLTEFRDHDPVVVGIARSGVPVAIGVARVLELPVHVVVVRKLELEGDPCSTLGAVAEDGSLVLVESRCDERQLQQLTASATNACKALVARYRDGGPIADVRGRTVIVVDDAISTGATAKAAVRLLRRAGAAKLVVAVPFALAPGSERVRKEVDRLVALEIATPREPVRCRYASFERLTEDELVSAFRASSSRLPVSPPTRLRRNPVASPCSRLSRRQT